MLDAKTANRPLAQAQRSAPHAWESELSEGLAGQAPSVHHNMPIAQIMTTDVITLPPELTLDAATRILLDKGISGAPVVDENQHPTGMVSKTDLLEAWQQRAQAKAQNPADEQDGDGRVGDIMVPYLLAVSHRAPISLATALMAYEGVHRLVVLGENNKMVGIVTSLDIVRWVAEVSGFGLTRATRLQRT